MDDLDYARIQRLWDVAQALSPGAMTIYDGIELRKSPEGELSFKALPFDLGVHYRKIDAQE